MKSGKLSVSISIIVTLFLLKVDNIVAGTVSKLSNIFSLDTRTEDILPVNGWQILTDKGDTYNEDIVIDDQGKVWCFYYRSPGALQPVHLIIFRSDGTVYKREQIVGYGSDYAESNYNSIRAAENDSTGDVWVAIQGAQAGYFVIFDSTGIVKQDSTLIDKSAFFPKIAAGKNGKMWFSWLTQIEANAASQGKIACYSANGEIELGPNTIGGHTYIHNTDIALDDSNRIWTVFEIYQGGDYVTKFSIYNNDLELYLDGKVVANNSAPLNSQRQIFSDEMNHKIWILEKNTTITEQRLHLYALDGTTINTIEMVGDCGFVRNENNFLEVIRFNDQNSEDKIYETYLYLPQTGDLYWNGTKFDSTFQFIRNCIAYNHDYPTLKAYAVQFDTNLTKIKFEQVSPGVPEISVKSVSFDTTKIKPFYVKQRPVLVTNNGSEILKVNNIIPNDPHFTVSDTAFSLLPGQSRNIIVSFIPTNDDSIVDYIWFLSNDPVNDSLKVTISGNGYYPTNPIITVDEDSLIFDAVIIGNVQPKYIYVFNNDFYEPLKVISIRSSNSQFIATDTSGFSLNPQKGRYIGVTFKPTEVGPIEGFLTIISNDTTNSELNIQLSGTGIRYGTHKILVNPDTLDFGEVALGHQKSLYLVIENIGETNLDIYNISIADTQFSANLASFTIAPKSAYYVLITYHVKRLDSVNTIVTINSSDLSIPNYYLPVVGSGRDAIPPTISLSLESLDFGSLPIGSTKTSFFSINNLGEDPLYIRTIQSNDSRFKIYQNSLTVNAGYPQSVTVTFSPDVADTINGMLTIVSNDAKNDTTYLNLIGIGRNLTVPQMDLSTQRIDFGQVAITQSLTRTFTIHNTGEQLLEVTKIELSGSNHHYSVNPTSLTVPYGQYRTVYVTFSPQQTGTISGAINITSNDPKNQSIALYGTGRNPLPQNSYVSHTSVDFDSVAITKSKSQYIWIKNIGEKPLTIQNISTADTSFTVNINSMLLNPGQTQYVFISFAPSLPVFYQDNLIIQSDDPDNPTQYVALIGHGRQLRNQNIQLSTSSLSYGEVAVGQQKVFELTIYNTGEKELSISNISNSDSVFSVDNRVLVVSPQSDLTIYVTFNPQVLVNYNDTLKIANNDPDTPIIHVPINGSGRMLHAQKIMANPDSLNFGAVGISLTSNQNIQLRNDGEVDLKIDSIKTTSKYFIPGNDGSFSINPGLSTLIAVAFQPDSVGIFDAVMTIYSNDLDTSEFRIPLIGNGRQLLDPNITFYPDKVDFGYVAVGLGKEIKFNVGNNGEKDLFVNNIFSSDDQFIIDKTSFTVKHDSSQNLTVTFRPTVMDTIETQLIIVSNDPDSAAAVMTLTGIGRALKEPQLVSRAEELNFGVVELGQSLQKNLVIENLGDLSLQLYSTVSLDSHFVVNVDSVSIEGGQSYNLAVTFFPDDTLEVRSNLEIKSNDPDNYVFYLPLRGKGKAGVQQILVSPVYLDFNEVRVHSTATRYFWVNNLGEKPLTISNVISNNVYFKPQLTNFTIGYNEYKQVPVIFTPDSIKLFNGKLAVISNDPVVDSLIILLTGEGRDSLAQKISVLPDSLNFDKVALNNSRNLYITLTNYGERLLKVHNVLCTNPVFKTNLTNFSIAPQSSRQIYVSFTPTVLKAYQDTLKIISDDPEKDTLLVNLSGIGREPFIQQIAVSDTTLNFGTVATDRSKSLSFAIRNEGEKNLEISQITVSNNQFLVNEQWLIINPKQTHYLTVVFSPRQNGEVNATLTLKSNDPIKPNVTVKLAGNGAVYAGPKISIHAESLYFGNTMLGVTKKLSLWIFNPSKDSTLNIESFSFDDQAFSISQSSLAVRPNDSSAVQVKFKPNAVGAHSAQIIIISNDKYQKALDFWVYGNGVEENIGQNILPQLGWKSDGYTPIGSFFSPSPHTDSLLSDAPDRVWLIKDIYLASNPQIASINLCFDDEIQLFINNVLVLVDTSNQPLHWNVYNRNIKSYLKLGRNRISIVVWNKDLKLGGFDCELIVNGESKIKRGDQNWTHPDATWWHFGEMGKLYPTPPLDMPLSRLWFHNDYGLAGVDTVVSDWTFEPTGNDTLYDNSPYGQKAILHNVTWIKGIIGQAMQFSGMSNSYAELYSNINRIPQFIELWFNCYGARQHAQSIITNKGNANYGQGLFIDRNMRLGVYYYDGIFTTQFTVNPNIWYFVSTQYKFDKILVYVNNSLVDSISYVQGNPVGSNICYLGGNPLEPDTTTSFYGAIDELQIRCTDTSPALMPQVAKIAKAPVDTTAKGKDVQLSFDIYPTPYQILSGTFEYTWGGSEVFRSKSLSYQDSSFTTALKLVIPSDLTTVRGLKYRISLQTNYGEIKYPEDGNGYSWVDVTTLNENSAITLPSKVHRMVSVPYVLSDPLIDAVLVDDFGEENPYNWRLFDWSQEDTNYIVYSDSTWQNNAGFSRGKAYWLITNRDRTYDAGSGRSPDNENYRINLNPGWNMIGNPFPYPVSWSDIEKSSELIPDPIYRSTVDSIGWIYNVETLNPWEGYFVWNGDGSNRSLIVPPKEAHERSLEKQAAPADKYLSKYPDAAILIAADLRCGKFIDAYNLFGTAENATEEYDKYDLKEAPAIGDYVSLWIDNRNWKKMAGPYTVDIRKNGSEGCAWDIFLDYFIEKPTGSLKMKFQPVTNLPTNWLMYLFDPSEDIAINLNDHAEITLNPVGNQHTRKPYKLVIGTESYVLQNSNQIPLVPLEFALFQNYPNPFNSVTTISFDLPKRMHVSVKIYNILGQLVKTIADEEIRGGHHKFYWDARNDQDVLVTTGVYIIRMQAKDNVAVKKLLLIK